MAKQDKSKFQLNKGTDHGFDISKGGNRKFDLSKDDDEPVVAPVKPQPATVAQPEASAPAKKQSAAKQQSQIAGTSHSKETDTGNSSVDSTDDKKNGKVWLWIALAIFVILLAWWLWPSSDTSEPAQDNAIEEVAAPEAEPSDSIAEETVDPEVANGQSENPSGSESDASTTTTPASGSKMTSPASVTPADNTPVASSAAATPAKAVPASSTTVSDDIEQEALKVIRGDYGIGNERKTRLGNKYTEIQARVNQLKREGKF